MRTTFPRSLVGPAASLVFTLGAVAGAQQARATLDVGSSNVRYADSISITALTLSPAFTLARPAVSLGGFGTLSQASGASSYSGSLYGALSSPTSRRISVEAGGSAGGSSHSDGARTGQLLGTGRMYANAERGGGWLGAGLGRTWDGAIWRGLVQGSAGAWISSATASAVASLSPTAVDDSIRYTDASLTLHRETGRLEFGASLGTRFGEPLPKLVTDRVWGSVSATAWMRPWIGVMLSGGTYPIDFTQGYPGGRFVSLALRLATVRAAQVPALAPAGLAPATPDVRAIEVGHVGDGVRRLRVLAPGARTVEITGDFTSWVPLALAAEGNGWWSISHRIAAGTHNLNVRVNGGGWLVPPGLVALRDEFGGSSGLLVIP